MQGLGTFGHGLGRVSALTPHSTDGETEARGCTWCVTPDRVCVTLVEPVL